MKRLLSTIATTVIWTVAFSQYNLQIQEIHPAPAQFEAQHSINVLPGASLSANPGNEIKVKIDPFLSPYYELLAVEYSPFPLNDRSFDYSLPVAGMQGTGSVGTAGEANYSIPIELPPGINDLQPSLAINYGSHGYHGMLGDKWNLSGLSSITRIGKNYLHDEENTAVELSSNDRYAMDGQRLVMDVGGTYGADGQEYFTEFETFTKVISHGTSGSGPEKFTAYTKSGLIIEYGHTVDSRKLVPGTSDVLTWGVNKISDQNGNYILFDYIYTSTSNWSLLPTRISYTGNSVTSTKPMNHIFFQYYWHDKAQSNYIAGKEMSSAYVVSEIRIFESNGNVGNYKFKYADSNLPRLIRVDLHNGDGQKTNPVEIRYHAEPLPFESLNRTVGNEYNYLYRSGDFNGDGTSDLLRLPPYYDETERTFEKKWRCFVSSANGSAFSDFASGTIIQGFEPDNVFVLDINNDGYSDFVYCKDYVAKIHHGSASGLSWVQDITLPWQFIGSYIGDYDGNGVSELLVKLAPNSDMWILKYDKNSGYILSKLTAPLNYGQSPNDRLTVADFDGNGQTDVLVAYDAVTKIYSLNGLTPVTIYSGTYPDNQYPLYTGDFNGDGKADILKKVSGDWQMAYYTGTGFDIEFQDQFLDDLFVRQAHYPPGYAIDELIYIMDLDGNGLSDILQIHDQEPVSGQPYTPKIRFKQVRFESAIPGGTVFREDIIQDEFVDDPQNYAVTDFNGDGRPEVFSQFRLDEPGDLWQFYSNNKRNLVLSILDGFNLKTEFDYDLLTNEYTGIYEKTGLATGFAYKIVTAPLYVANYVRKPNGVGGKTTLYYSYKDLLVHSEGKGMMGFLSVTAKENFETGSGIYPGNSTVQQFDYITSDKFPHLWLKDIETYNSANTLVSKASSTVKLKVLAVPGNFGFYVYPDHKSETNYLTNTTITYDFTYDEPTGNLVQEVIDYGGIHTKTTDYQYGQFGSWIANKPTLVTVTELESGQPAYSSATQFDYDSKGNLTKSVAFFGKPKAMTRTMSYDAFGNMTQSKLEASGLTARINNFEYSQDGRFLIKKTDPLNFTEEYSYDQKWGELESEARAGRDLAHYKYDGFGQLEKSTLEASGHEVTFTRTWLNNSPVPNAFIKEEVTTPNHPEVIRYYDQLGRDIREESELLDGSIVYKDKIYNYQGELWKASDPYKDTETPTWTQYTYDINGRKSNVQYPNQTLNYQYNNNSITETHVQSGQSKTIVNDAHGKMINAIDNGGTINYEYWSHGKPKKVGNTIELTYDDYKQIIAYDDADAGLISYSYNAFGELISQTDARGNNFTMIYDVLGRVVQKSINGESYDFTYAANGEIEEATGPNGFKQKYQYDTEKRITTYEEKIDGENFVYSYEYATNGNLSKITYPNGFTVIREYDNEGYLVRVKRADNNQTIWEHLESNSKGMITKVELGNGLIETRTFDNQFFPSAYSFGNNSYTYVFDTGTGNLSRKCDNRYSLCEDYEYDDLNRLIDQTISGSPTNPDPVSITYADNGNIETKSDVGEYQYNSDSSPHAMTGIGNPSSAINEPTQIIEYTYFNKVSTIREGIFEAGFEYGPDNNIRKMHITRSGEDLITRKYIGHAYEIDLHAENGSREICYIETGAGVSAMYISTPGQAGNIYYLHPDYQGNIIAISDDEGNIVEELSYDPWGNRRSSSDWENVSDWSGDYRFSYRGYTGHEHLDMFSLINMRGRLYDPVTGRMLSPDNHVQMPENTQNLNRYSYALNNPLIYTDPTGDFLFLPFFVKSIFSVKALIGVGTKLGVAAIANATITGFLQGGLTQDQLYSTMANGATIGISATSTLRALGAVALSHVPTASVDWGDFQISLGPSLGYSGLGYGVNTSFRLGVFRVGVGGRYTHFTDHMATGLEFGETMVGWSLAVEGDNTSLSIYEASFAGGVYDQTVNGLAVQVGDFKFRYENDGHPLYAWLGLGDGGDRGRTTGVAFELGDYSVNFNLYTGDPYLDEEGFAPNENYGLVKGDRRVARVYTGAANDWRLGLGTIGYKDYRYGINNEWIRHFLQNYFAHSLIEPQPKFERLPDKLTHQIHLSRHTYNPFTLW